MTPYRRTEGTRPDAGAGWYYGEHRERVSDESRADRAVSRLESRRSHPRPGSRPSQLSIPLARLVGEVVAVEPEPGMAYPTRAECGTEIRDSLRVSERVATVLRTSEPTCPR